MYNYTMCFNATTSMITFLISSVCSSLLLYTGITENNKNDLLYSSVVILIGLMQLIEYFLWKNQNCNKINHMFSLLIIVLLFLQGLVITIVYYFLYPNKRFFSKQYVFYFLLLYTIFTSYLLYYLNQTMLCSKPLKNSCRLCWAPYTFLIKNNIFLLITHILFYFTTGSIVAIELFINRKHQYLIRSLFLPVTFILSYLFVIFNEMNKKFNPILFLNYSDVFGSLWCFMAVFLGFVAILHI